VEEMGRRDWVATATAVLIVGTISVWESLVCWQGFTGCLRPWDVGWRRYLTFLGVIVSGTFSPWIVCGIDSRCVVRDSASILGVVTLFGISPILAFAVTKRRDALVAAALLWLAIGFYFAIGIWV
jgi:hypothetical protein